ncbi:hypothetical protein PAMP_011722 [Pampus punctatissimus]
MAFRLVVTRYGRRRGRRRLKEQVILLGVSVTEMLLDMRATGGELGWLTWPLDQGDKSGWEVVQRTLNGSQFYTYSVCNVGEREQDNWLRTTFIQRRPSASRVFVELQFVVRDCNSFGGASMTCKETFNLFTSESDADVGTTFRKGQFKKVATIAPDEITSKNEVRINTETRVVENLSRKGFYLAFQDIGACVALLSVKVYYKTCPATVKSLASFPETVAGGENQVLREVNGLCVDNAISEEVPRIYCTVDGEWVVPVGQCQCKPGHEEVEDACQGRARSGNRRSPNPSVTLRPVGSGLSIVARCSATFLIKCKPGFFKAAASGDKCEPCPSNTQRLGSGALSCPCMDGFYRAPTDPPTGPCSGLPSAPQDLMATTTQLSAGKLLLSWNPPEDKGGRTDITYSIECQRCEGTVCLPCGEKIRYDPASMGLTDTKVSVSELDAHLNYTFTVEAHSGVSLFASQATAGAKRPPSASTLTTSLHNTDPPKITSIRLVERFDTSLSLSWDVSPRPRILHRPLRYELTYRKKDDNLDVTTYTVLILEKNSVQISDLSPGTAYLFRVQALSSDGSPGGSTMEEQFETSSEGRLTQNNTAVIFGAAVGGAAMLFIVVVVLLVRRRKRNSHTRQGPEDTYFSSAEQLKPLKTYVDPHTYEDPNTAVLKFATEIHPSHITKQKVIGAVCYQLGPQTIICFSPQDHDGEFSSFQLVGMLRGIAAGMKYLSDMSYVHRDLAARNILVNNTLECKVSDFGLSRVLEDDPEGTYTTSVMKAINEAFRLPAPMDCPSAVYQLMLQCWLQERSKRPRFGDIVSLLDKLLRSPESLKTIADFDPRVSIRLPSTSGSDGSPFRSVSDWLESIKMSQYSENFTCAGIVNMDQVLQMKNEDIKNIGNKTNKENAVSVTAWEQWSRALAQFVVGADVMASPPFNWHFDPFPVRPMERRDG